MLLVSPTIKSDFKEPWVTVTVTNLGDNPVTLNSLILSYYATKVIQFRIKPKCSRIVKPFYATLPHKLLQGEQWCGGLSQVPKLEEMARDGILMANMHIAGRKKPRRARIKMK